MAEVFKCRLSGIGGFDKLVVIKRIRPELVSDPHFVDMFLDEARIAANLSHSNIIQIYEIDQVAGIPYISMEYVRGPTLSLMARETQAQNKLHLAVAAKVMSGICAALDYAHSAVSEDGTPLGIIHRDVTPQNILISLDGVPKLLDFGVAKARGQIAHTSAGSIKGKFKFMAPEVFLGEKQNITPQVDVFAAGVCLYQATTFHLPYEGETELEVMKAAAGGKFPRPSELVPGFDPALEEIILWAMAPQVKDRCPNALTLHKKLEEYAQQRGCTQATVQEHLRSLFPEDPSCEPAPFADVLSSDIVMTPVPPSSTRSAVLWGSRVMPVSLGKPIGVPPPMLHASGVRSRATRPPPLQIRLPVPPEESEERSVDIDIADSGLGKRRHPTWMLLASVAMIIAGIFTGALVVTRKAELVVAAAPPLPQVVEAVVVARPAPAPAPAPVPVVAPPAAKIAVVDPLRFQKTIAAGRVALDQGKFIEAATLARQVLAEQIDEPAALALLHEATEAARRAKVVARPAPVKMGGLSIETEPIAQVFLDGKLLGWSPITRRNLPEGTYQVGARHARREPAVQDVRVVAGRETMLKLQLSEKNERPRARPAPVAAPPPEPVEPEPVAEVAAPAPRPEPVVHAPPPPAPVVAAAAAALPQAKSFEEAPLPERRSPSSASLSFECPDDARFVRAALPEGAQAWCETDRGEKHGKFVRLFPNGRKAEEGEFRRGKKHGRWMDYYEQGGERGRVEWRKGVQSW
jgi:serine/threonine protein kinase